MEQRLCIIPCGAKKIWDVDPERGAVEAQHAYLSAFHKACQRYAVFFYKDWVILSAKHGFLYPTDPVPGAYDVGFHHDSNEKMSIEDLQHQWKLLGMDRYSKVTVLGGKKYERVVRQVLGSEYELDFPLSDCRGIGFMLQKLKNAVEQRQKIK